MSKWQIRTGDYQADVDHAPDMTAMEATVLAFKTDPSKGTGIITECTHPDGTVFYVHSVRALERAGFDCEKIRL